MRVLGLDIGGANLKLADSQGRCAARPFPIWRTPDKLAAELRSLESLFPPLDLFAVTMTAELADCFETKGEGVERILSSVQVVAGDRPVLVWMTDGRLVTPAVAVQQPLIAAASNWQALATWAARSVGQAPALLIDIGTTTTDLIPIDGGRPATTGRTDVTRLMAGELVYTGVRRTPLCAIAPTVPFLGTDCPLAAEWFATSLDIHLLSGHLPEDVTDLETANNRPATIQAAHDRLARQLCCDREELTLADAVGIARHLAERQAEQIAAAINLVLRNRPMREAVIISGSGSFLARQIVARNPQLRSARIVDLNETWNPAVATAACAYAVAVLAEEFLKSPSAIN